MKIDLMACWHAVVITLFIVFEAILITQIVKAIWRRRHDPLPPEAHEASHSVRNEAAALRGVLRRLGSEPDPLATLNSLREDNRLH